MHFKKILFKIIIITLLTSFSLCLVFENFSYAKGFADKLSPSTAATGSFEHPLEIIIGIVQVVAVGMAAIMLVFLAIKYMTSSVNEKAEIKKHAVVYVVGAIIAFAASGILEIFKDFVLKNVK